MDCHTRQLLGWHLSRSAKSKTAEAALEQALISRFGSLGRVRETFLLRSDNVDRPEFCRHLRAALRVAPFKRYR